MNVWKKGLFITRTPRDYLTMQVGRLTPHLVRSLDEAGDGVEKKSKIEAMQQGWLWAERRWSQITTDTGTGNPKAATREKGEKFFKTITEKVAAAFVELARTDVNSMYE